MQLFVLFAVSLLASIVGAVTGIGGGILIKPSLDALRLMDIMTINFLSGCTVLTMTLYNTCTAVVTHDNMLKQDITLFLGIGAAVGGIGGKRLFAVMTSGIPSPHTITIIQSSCMLILTIVGFIYTLAKHRIKPKRLNGMAVKTVIGFALGLVSAFLGIGGGPINLAVFRYFFTLDVKEAAQNSLAIILLSQLASLIYAFVTRSVPAFESLALGIMAACGIVGGIIGRGISKRISDKQAELLFRSLMIVICAICVFNIIY